MSWYCCGSSLQRTNNKVRLPPSDSTLLPATNSQLAESSPSSSENKESNTAERTNDDSAPTRKIHEFTYQQLLDATQRFNKESIVDVRSVGSVYHGKLRDTGEDVCVELWDRKGSHGHKEFLQRLKLLSFLNHPNVITLIGHCTEGNRRLLVYEYFPLGSSLHYHLYGKSLMQESPLDWNSRMKIALGIARGLECIHAASPPTIYFYLDPCYIIIDDDFNAKLSDFGQSKVESYDDIGYVCTTLIGVPHGGCHAPEYIATGCLSVKADVYSFGVVLLELVTGRKRLDISMPTEERNLISWAQKKIKKPKKFPELADPLLQGNFPANGFSQALALVVKCLRLKESTRPMMSDVVADIMCLISDNLDDKRLV